MEHSIEKAAAMIKNAENVIALTGAGISVESGIPDFRSAGGLWDKYDPAVYATINSFIRMPEKVWEMLFDMVDLKMGAKPNPGHLALADLESMGHLGAIITQNIDNLHQEAGNRNVIEYHGNVSRLQCIKCGTLYGLDEFDLSKKVPPRCADCDRILKPTVIFFGEAIPYDAQVRSQTLASKADLIIVVGTSAVVYPAASIPMIAKDSGARVIEFNIEETPLTHYLTDILVLGSAGKTLPELVGILRRMN
ncbi:MAG: NAD-dependent deacylase [Spirochaetes bacterium]|jgi:NAD-dependent deacetylase|nr:NAD-dependent deacylase [Spirochaetota bacterium]